MPISVELWRAAVERWVARIKRTLIIRRGVKRAPSNDEGAPSPSGQSHTGEKKCMVKKKGRKKRKNDSCGDPGITTDDFYDGVIALAATFKGFGSNPPKDCRDKNPVAPLKELLGCTGLGPLLVVIMIILLRSGDVEPNPKPVKRVDASFSLEQCFAALCFCAFLLALSIQQALACSVGLIKAPLCVHSREVALSPTGKPDDDKAECLANTTGQMKHKNGLSCDTMVTRDRFNVALASVLKGMIIDAKFTDGSGRNIVCTQVELKGLSQLLGIVGLLLRSGSGEANTGAVEGVDTSFSLEQCFAALCFCVFLLALSIQQTLTCSVGLIKAPLCVHSREVALSPTEKPDDDKAQCLVNTTGRMKHKDGLSCDTMVTRDRFNVALASVLKSMIGDVKFTDGSGRNIVCIQVELKSLSQLLGIVCLLLRSGSGEANTGPVEGGPISRQGDGMVFDESLHVEVNNDYHCAKWMKSDPEASDNLRCRVSNDVLLLSSAKLGNLVLSAKNTMAMTALIAIFLWCMVLVDRVCIVGLLAFLLEVTLAKMKKRKAGFKPGTAVTLHSPSQQAYIFKSGLVIHLFTICVSVFKRYEHQTMSQHVCCLLVFNLASLLREVKCTEKFLSVTFCFALLRHSTCIGKWLSQAVFKPYVFLRGLLLLAGDVETNPGPIQAEVVLLDYRDRFIAEVDTSTVVMDLLHRGIIDEVDQKVIAMEHNPNKRNQLLHACLMKKCTNDALKTVCDVMTAVPSNPRMAALGNDMRRRVEMGVSGDARGQVCIAPPTTTGPHFVEHHTGDMRYDGSGPSMPDGDSTPARRREDVRGLATNVTVQVVKDYTKEFLLAMDATAIALQLRVQGLLPESVKCDIDHSKCREDANGHLLTFLSTGASEIQVQQTLKVASEKIDYGRMSQFAAKVLQQLQPATQGVSTGPLPTAHSQTSQLLTAGEPLAKRVLMDNKAEFLKVLAVYRIYRELCEKKVIDRTVEKDITKSQSVEEARGHLFDHMRDYGTVDTLKVFCDVITSEEYNGIQAMQDFGAKIKRRLAQEGEQHHVSGDSQGSSGITTAPPPPAPPTSTRTPLSLPPHHSAQTSSRKRSASPLALRAHPMSPWNRDALVSVRGDLKLKVSMSTGLFDILEEVAGGFMSPREAQVVREQQGSSEQMGRLVDILCGKGDKDFSTFLQMLRRTNNKVWAEELKKKAKKLKREKGAQPDHQPADPDGKAWFSTDPLAQKYLKCVRGYYSEMSVTGEYPHLDYIPLRVIKSHPSQHKKEDTVQFLKNFQRATVDFISQQDGGITSYDPPTSGLSHDHFLKKQEKPLHIVFGPPGTGKTSFSRHICSQFNSAPQSSSFSLVLLFYLREKRVAEAKTLSDLLSCYGLPDQKLDYDTLSQMIADSQGRGIQIIFDGLDERQDLLKDETSIVTRLLKGELKEAQVVVNSRPGIVTQLSKLWHRASLYEVQGFSHLEVKQYIESFFLKEGNPSAASTLLAALADRPDLTGSTYTPLNLWLICSVFSFKNCTLPDTLTQCYTALFAQLLQHQAMKEGLETAVGDTLDTLPASMLATLDCLSQLSYLCYLKEELVFDEEVVIRTCLSSRAELKGTFDGMSLLHVHPKKHGAKDHLTFNFLHSTYQEYLCARHILTAMSEEEQTAFWKENISNPRFAMVFRFYCGLSELKIRGVQEIVKGQELPSKCSIRDRRLLFLFYALHESSNSHLTAAVAEQLHSELTFDLLLSPYDFYVMQYCLSKTTHLRTIGFPRFRFHQPSEFAIPCISTVASTNALTSLGLGLSSFTLSDAQHLTAALVAVEDLDLHLEESSIEAVEELLLIPTLRQLTLDVTSFNDLQTSPRSRSVSNVSKLDLSLPPEGDACLARCIPNCPQLEELKVNCDSKGAGDVVAAALPNLKCLRKVTVRYMNPVPVLQTVGWCGKLKEVTVRYPNHCEPTTEDWCKVSSSVANAQHLQKMDLHLGESDINFLQSILPCLASSQSLQELVVWCDASGAGEVLADRLLSLRSVEKLHILDIDPAPVLSALSENAGHCTVSTLGVAFYNQPELCCVSLQGVGGSDMLGKCRSIRNFELYLNEGPKSLTALNCWMEGVRDSPSINNLSICCLDKGAGPAVAQLLPNVVGRLMKLSMSLLDPTNVLESLQDSSVASLTLVMSHLRPMTPPDQARLQALVAGVRSRKVSVIIKQELQFPYYPWITSDASCGLAETLCLCRGLSENPHIGAGEVSGVPTCLMSEVQCLLKTSSSHSVTVNGVTLRPVELCTAPKLEPPLTLEVPHLVHFPPWSFLQRGILRQVSDRKPPEKDQVPYELGVD